MKFLVDTQLPISLANFFVLKGFDCIHTTFFKDGHLLKDSTIRQKATSEGRIVITKDSDFSDYFFVKGSPPSILLVVIGNTKNQELLAITERLLDAIVESFEAGFGLVVLGKQDVTAFSYKSQ